ncbi:MAG TPA: GyrI-like domain-containing protein [Acidimicrobiia bacterium]|nr:GyrI-like domain-containing protein [Acidimicrobiia bacterium]
MQSHSIRSETRGDQPTAVMVAILSASEIGDWMPQAFESIFNYLSAKAAPAAGPPFARYHRLDETHFEVEAGFPLVEAVEGDGIIRSSSLPGGPVAVTTHVGPYDAMKPAYDALGAWVEERGFDPVGDRWDTYFSDPDESPDARTWRAEIVQPYRPA